jgi:hypothetical protein
MVQVYHLHRSEVETNESVFMRHESFFRDLI